MAVRLPLITAIAAVAALSPVVVFAKSFEAPMPGQLLTAVPEPATWAMMLVGFGLMGALLRVARRRRTATA